MKELSFFGSFLQVEGEVKYLVVILYSKMTFKRYLVGIKAGTEDFSQDDLLDTYDAGCAYHRVW